MPHSVFNGQSFSLDKICAWAAHQMESPNDGGGTFAVKNAWGTVNAGLNISLPITGAGGIVGGTDAVADDIAIVGVVTKQTRSVTAPASGNWQNYDTDYGYGDGTDDMILWLWSETINGDLPGPVVFTLDANADPVDAVAVIVILTHVANPFTPDFYPDNSVDNTSSADSNAPSALPLAPTTPPGNKALVLVGASSHDTTTPTITPVTSISEILQEKSGNLSVGAYGLVDPSVIADPAAIIGLEEQPASPNSELVLQAADVTGAWTLRSTPDDNPGVDATLDRICFGTLAGGTPAWVGVSRTTGHVLASTDGITWSNVGTIPAIAPTFAGSTVTPGTICIPCVEQGMQIPTISCLNFRFIDGHYYLADGLHLWQNTTVDDLSAWTDLAPSITTAHLATFYPFDIAYDGTTLVVCGIGLDNTGPGYGTRVLTMWSTAGPSGPWSNGLEDLTTDSAHPGNTIPGFYSGNSNYTTGSGYDAHCPMLYMAYGNGEFVCVGNSNNILMEGSSSDGQTWNTIKGNPNAGSGGPDNSGYLINCIFDLCFRPSSLGGGDFALAGEALAVQLGTGGGGTVSSVMATRSGNYFWNGDSGANAAVAAAQDPSIPSGSANPIASGCSSANDWTVLSIYWTSGFPSAFGIPVLMYNPDTAAWMNSGGPDVLGTEGLCAVTAGFLAPPPPAGVGSYIGRLVA